MAGFSFARCASHIIARDSLPNAPRAGATTRTSLSMRNAKFSALLALTLFSTGYAHGATENPQFVLAFGGQPGLPLTHSYDYGLPAKVEPFYTMRIPIVDKVVNAIFHDTEMRILREGKIVDFIHAERAFASLADCTAARDALDRKLQTLLPTPYTAAKPWEHRSEDGVTLGAAWCESERQLPNPILHLELTRATNAK